MKYRKKPVVIDAWQLTEHSSDEVAPDWATAGYTDGKFGKAEAPRQWWVMTLEGLMTGAVGDWLIRGIKGELYFCKPDIFEATYEVAE